MLPTASRVPARKGFTLVELAVVIVIIGVLAAFGVPRFLKSVERSKAAEAFAYLSAVRSSQERYLAQYGEYSGDITKLDIQYPTPAYFTVGDRHRHPEHLDPDPDPHGRLGRLRSLHGDLHRSGLRRDQLDDPGDAGHQPDQQFDQPRGRPEADRGAARPRRDGCSPGVSAMPQSLTRRMLVSGGRLRPPACSSPGLAPA